MSYRNNPPAVFLTTLVAAACLPPLLPAEQPAAALEPLVVTAEAAPGQALLEKDLDLFQAVTLADLSTLVPGFAVVTSDTRGYGDILSMRGSANTLFFSAPAVGMTVDDVPMGDTYSYPAGLLQLDQVKILRGPQGTTYGLNGAAGMIDMTTPRPGDQTATQWTLGSGSYNSWDANVSTGGPLGQGLAQTFQFYHQQRDGFIDNPTLGHATDDRSLTGALANLFWQPAADREWRLRVLAERADDGGPRLSSLFSKDPFQVESDIPGETAMQRYQISLHYTQEGPWGRLKSITAWQDWKLDPNITDLNLTAVPGWSSTILQDQRLWSQEFRWESPQDASPWSWRTGVFFMNQANSGDTTRTYPVYGWPYSEMIRYDLDQWNVATYGRISYALNARLQVLAGMRVEYVDSQIDRTKTDSFFSPASVVNEDQGAWYGSPELGASYAWSDTTRLFARSAIGTKPAGYSAFARADMARYDDEQTWTNELGAEWTLPDQHLTCSLTGFWNLSRDYQVNRSDLPTVSTDFFTVNAGQVTSLGAEAQLRWQPVAGLTLQGSAGYVNATFDSYQDPMIPGLRYDGNTVPFVPEFTASLGARYDFPHGFYLQSALRLTGPTYFNEANTDLFHQGSYLCWDAEIGYARDQFSVALFGRNLLDREYYTFINPQIYAGSPGDPQIFGIRATLEF